MARYRRRSWRGKRTSKEDKLLRRRWRSGRLAHWCGVFLRILLAAVLALLVLLHRMFLGPSQTVCDMLTMSLLESSALKFVPYMYMRSEEVDEIIARCAVVEREERVDPTLVTVARTDPSAEQDAGGEETPSIELVKVTGSSYKGYMMIVHDPSRVFLAMANETGARGRYINEIVEGFGAVGGINASGFYDPNGTGNGASPQGTVISKGELIRYDPNITIAGFDQNDILHVGRFTRDELDQLGLRDAAGWGPALIINGEPSEVPATKTGLNPRTAIGQRADGAALLLVVDGRHASSIGASYTDLIDIMMNFGAVNACNLDGGYSSIMYYEGRRVSDVTTLDDSRRIPNAFLIREEESK